ncbi:hypothetical protein [Mycoplasma leonicaptivi]|uniref:hypothetical protein n=1 Tax=Mycoplasma leonicaptivi TaxID=36742 RepID=UPI0006875C08|nr:hypothetical protein [Mycoplasma leonicaptivi]
MKITKIFKRTIVPATIVTTTSVSVSCSDPSYTNHPLFHKNAKITRNTDIDFTKYGIQKFSGHPKVRILLFPAQQENVDETGIFNIALHLSPVRGVTGEWIAFATEVKSENDNTLVEPLNVKQASTIAKTNEEYPLQWSFDGDQKIRPYKSYTFIFWKKDGSEVIVFSKSNIESNKDIFYPYQIE